MPKDKQQIDDSKSEEFKNLVDLVALYSDLSNRVAEMETEANAELLEIIDDKRASYASLQAKLTEVETALETLALKHPEWFETRKSIRTPYGTIKLTRTTKLHVPNEELSIVLIEREAERQAAAEVGSAESKPPFDADTLIRSRKTLDLEALEKLSDADLKRFRIERVTSQSFSVSPAKVDMGKAVKEAAAKEAA